MCGFGLNSFGRFGYGNLGGFGIGMGIMMLVRVIILVIIIIAAVRLFKGYTLRNSSPMRILDQKYAKGEITEEEYMRRRDVLSQK